MSSRILSTFDGDFCHGLNFWKRHLTILSVSRIVLIALNLSHQFAASFDGGFSVLGEIFSGSVATKNDLS